MRVRYTRRALAQLDELYSFIEARNPRAARAINDRIKHAIARLEQFPYSCRQTDRPDVRVLSIARASCLVFYSVDRAAREVLILRVRHSARDPMRHLD